MIRLRVASGTKVAANAGGESQSAQNKGNPALALQPRSTAKAKEHVKELLLDIRTAHDRKQRKKARHLARRYLGSFDARYLAVLKAFSRLRRELRPEASILPSRAASLNAWIGTPEKVLIRLRQKPGNPDCFRTILEFGLENRALQLLVLPLLKAQANLHPNQYQMRGVHAAIKRVARLLEDGNQWAIETDIANCYPSFDGEKVSEFLPIPKEVTRRVLLGGALSLQLGSDMFGPADPGEDDEITFSELFADARRGLPQGSATSPLVAEMLLASLFHNLPTDGAWIGYADNFLAMGKTESDVVSMTSALCSAVKVHPAGQFRPKVPRVYTPNDPIEFLGHRLRLSNGVIRIDPTSERLKEFSAYLEISLRAIKKTSSKTVRIREVRRLQRYVRSWTAAFTLCTDIETRRETALKRIAMVA